MEIMIILAIMAVLAAIAIPAYNNIIERSERSVDLDNAQTIVGCLNSHNQASVADETIEPITGAMVDDIVSLSGIDIDGDMVADIDTVSKFNSVCENKISLLTDEDYEVALAYVRILSEDNEFTIKEEYTHR